MSGADAGIPAWQRLLARPRRLHRLATVGLWLAAIVVGTDAFLRGAPGGVSDDVRILTYLFDGFAWITVLLSACAEAYLAAHSATRPRAGGRPHFQIVFVLGVMISLTLVTAYSILGNSSPESIGMIGRLVKAGLAALLPLVVGVTLTSGLAIAWSIWIQPRLESYLEARLRELERQQR
ncbi:MAG: hypothetical protein U0841_11505 [Chloroflexia bacterium]